MSRTTASTVPDLKLPASTPRITVTDASWLKPTASGMGGPARSQLTMTRANAPQISVTALTDATRLNVPGGRASIPNPT